MTTRRALLLLLTTTPISKSALACTVAAERGSLESQVLRAHKSAVAVVLAKVVDTRFQNPLSSPFGESPTHRATLEVIESWKGQHRAGSLLVTTTATGAGTCSIVLRRGETYLLYLHGKEPYDTSWSSRNANLGDAFPEIEILRSRFEKAR